MNHIFLGVRHCFADVDMPSEPSDMFVTVASPNLPIVSWRGMESLMELDEHGEIREPYRETRGVRVVDFFLRETPFKGTDRENQR